jgi:predicted esterase
VDRFFDALYQAAADNAPRWQDAPSFAEHKAAQRERLVKAIGLDRLDAFIGGPPVYEPLSADDTGEFFIERFRCRTGPELWTPFYAIHPHDTNNKGKCVIYLCGHGTSCEQVIDPAYTDDYQKTAPLLLARAGYIVLMPEMVGFGRTRFANYNPNKKTIDNGCYFISTQLLMNGMTTTALRVRQALDSIAYARSRFPGAPVVLMGISGGGLVTAYTGALSDDLAGCCVSCYANTFKGSIMAVPHCVDNFTPNVFSVGEEPEIISLACPTPLFITAGRDDGIFPVQATEEAIRYVRDVYAGQGAGARVTSVIFDGGHEISTEGLFPWLQSL